MAFPTSRTIVLASLLLTSTRAGSARAETPGESERSAARSMATRAMDLMRERRFDEAERLLQQSYDIVPAPTIGVLHGDALVRLGRLRRAERTFEHVSRTRLDPNSPPAFRQAVALSRRRLDELERRIPRLTLVVENASGDLEDLRIELNGEPLSPALLGIERRVDPGAYAVSVHEANGAKHEHSFRLREGQRERVVLDLHPADAPSPAIAAAGSERETWFTRRNVGWLSIGVGAAGITTGAIAGIVMSEKDDDLDAACNPGCPESVASDIDAFETARTVSLVSFGIGVVATSIGAALVLTDDSGQEKGRVAPYVAGRTIGLEGRF